MSWPDIASIIKRWRVPILVAAVAFVAIVVVLIRTTWTVLGWTALMAVAASVQALGVLGAVIFASAEIKSVRAESRRRRRDQLIDELSSSTFRTLAPALHRHTGAWRMALYYREKAATLYGEEAAEFADEYTERYDARVSEIQESDSELHAAIEDVSLVMMRLGEDRKVVLAKLQIEALRLPAFALPARPLESFDDSGGDAYIKGLHDAATEFMGWVRGYIREHVTSE